MTEIRVLFNDGWIYKSATIIESFGLPGGKYMTRLRDEYMIFSFNEPEDALMAKLIIGG